MELKQNCILLQSRPYRITDDKTGEINEGVSLRYLPVDNLLPVVDESNEHIKGSGTAKAVLPLNQLSKVVHAPALYTFTLTMNVGSDGKAVLKVKDIEFLNTISFAPPK